MVRKATEAQQRILDILADGQAHLLLGELGDMGFWNQFPAVRALEKGTL